MREPRFSRRTLLLGTGLVGGAALTAGAVELSRVDAPVYAMISKRLGSLAFDEVGLETFVADYMRHSQSYVSDRKWQVFQLVLPLYQHTDLLEVTRMGDYLYRHESKVVSDLLLSSDYFLRQQPSPESTRLEPIRYLGWFESSLCSYRNPFARFDLEIGEGDAAAERQETVYEAMGCGACHGEDGEGGTGPALKGGFDAMTTLSNGERVLRDRDYLIRSLLEPEVELVSGYGETMPSYKGLLGEQELRELLKFLEEF